MRRVLYPLFGLLVLGGWGAMRVTATAPFFSDAAKGPMPSTASGYRSPGMPLVVGGFGGVGGGK
jgi:hypothetical protein